MRAEQRIVYQSECDAAGIAVECAMDFNHPFFAAFFCGEERMMGD
jgi:hypothetical protein